MSTETGSTDGRPVDDAQIARQDLRKLAIDSDAILTVEGAARGFATALQSIRTHVGVSASARRFRLWSSLSVKEIIHK